MWFILKSNSLEQKPFTSLFLEVSFTYKSKIKKSGPGHHVSPPYSFKNRNNRKKSAIIEVTPQWSLFSDLCFFIVTQQ